MSTLTFKKAAELFSQARNPESGKPLANNTRLIREGKSFGVKLHNTVIVKIHPNDTYSLFMDGWNTVTTRDRINSYSPARVTTNRGIALVLSGQGDWIPQSEFYDGIKLNSHGKVISKVKDPARTKKIEAKLQREIAKYIRGYLEHIAAGKLERPSGGDCWMCSMFPSPGMDHLFSHLEENYFVPSLLINAFKAAYNPDYAGMHAEPFFKGGRDANEGALNRHSMARHALQKYFRKNKSAMLKERLS